MKKVLKEILTVLLPVALGAFIMYWVYRDFDFERVGRVLLHGTSWGWMVLSLLFGVLGHVFRGWRWKQTLAPLGACPATSNCVDAIFISYATSLVLPRLGEVSRCGVLARYDQVSFSKSLGTVVTERLLDGVCVLLLAGGTFLLQMPVFLRFFAETGTKIPSLAHLLGSVWFYVVLFCLVGVLVLFYYLFRSLAVFEKVRGAALNVWEGILSLRRVRCLPLFLVYTAGIWACYYLHFYLTFYSFSYTADLGVMSALIAFVVGSFAVLVPTPNGAGPWHFAVKTVLVLYGVSEADGVMFVLIVHTLQTLLVVLLGLYAGVALACARRRMPQGTVA